MAVVRAGTNPLGPGAPWVKAWFVDRDVNLADFPDYLASEFEMQFQTLEQNTFLDKAEYERRLKALPDHIRKAWLYGEFVIEGAYFTEFNQRRFLDATPEYPEGRHVPWHVIDAMPTLDGHRIMDLPWVSIYRAIDWGYHPDPAVCLWIAVIPGNRAFVFMERTWKRTLAADVAKDIKRLSRGMRIVETFADPTMNIKTGTSKYSIGEIFEQEGVPITPAQNDREVYGYSIHDALNGLVDDNGTPQPRLQIVRSGCPELIKTIPLQQMDPTDPRKLANGNDHYAVALAYFCMGNAMPSQPQQTATVPRWMRPKRETMSHHPYA